MSYEKITQWMFNQLPMYQNQGVSAYKANLDNTIKLDNYLGNPHLQFSSIHVAGTNGKGSTSHMLASILQEAGYKTGLYTSPHLKDFRERIKINGIDIKKSYVVDFIEQHQSFFEDHKLSFFEMTVGLAFQYFQEQKVDIAIIEVGLGGRLDSTNIITPKMSVITNIGMDHMALLGNTLEKIAVEKAGVIKEGVPVVIGETQTETEPVFRDKAKDCNAKIVFADQIKLPYFSCDLKGDYQLKNIQTARIAISLLDETDFQVGENHISIGLKNVVKNTGLKGRWQVLDTEPTVICDTAHNSHGIKLVMKQLLSMNYRSLHIVFGAVNDKDLDGIIPLLPVKAHYYFCKPNVIRGLDTHILESKFMYYNIKGESFKSVKAALKAAKQNASDDDIIFVGGSTFVVAEII